MNKRNGPARFLALFACPIAVLTCGYANAVDDGARAYWKGRAGTNAVSVQHLNLNMQGSEALHLTLLITSIRARMSMRISS